MQFKNKLTVAGLAVGLLANGALAQAPAATSNTKPYEPSFTVLHDDIHYDVHADGTYTDEEFESLRLNNDQGVKQFGQISLSYSTSLQDLEVIEAYTTSKDGKRIDVDPSKIISQQSAQSAGAPTFDDAKVKSVVFPAVEVGAVVNLRYRRTQKTPLFPGAFSMSEEMPLSQEIKSEQVTLTAPASLTMYVDATGLQGGEVPSDKPGLKIWRWSITNTTAHAPELGSVNPFDFSPHVIATTFTDYAAAGRAYLVRAQPKAAVTPAIQKLADQITAGITDKRAQADALYQWVSKDVRYVAVYLAFGGVVPHTADEIATARYGDCKDHVTVLEALLAAKGIKSSPVLVNASNTYSLPKVAITPGVFNHVITYLPEFNLFVDSTAGVAPFGALPLQELGKPALVTDDGHGVAKIVTLPLSTIQNDGVRVSTQISVGADGTVSGSSTVNNSGVFELLTRQVAMSVPKGLESQVAARVLTLTGQSGTGSYAFGDARDLSKPFAYTTQFNLPNLVLIPVPGALAVPEGLGSFSGIHSVFESMALPQRDFPMIVVSGHHEEFTTLTLPDSIKVTTLPKSVTIDSTVGHYEASYSQKGNTITVTRTLDLNLPTATIGNADYQKLRSLNTAVTRDLRSQILYQ